MSERRVLSVSALNGYIKNIVEGDPELASIYVRGELSNFTNHYKSGHLYMTLKDEKSVVRAVMFRSAASRLKFEPKSGMKVIVRARVGVFERDGQYQLYIESMEPDGIGALYIALEQLKQKLQQEGLLDEKRKRPLPRIPMEIGVITSPTGAAVRDIFTVLKRRFPLAGVTLYPVLVQGDGAPAQLCEALEYFSGERCVDVVIIGRGGGSIEELWAFNDERVARAIAASSVPVVSAVGHETDFTLADFVADRRAPTPSAAAEICVPDMVEMGRWLMQLPARFGGYAAAKIDAGRARLENLGSRRALARPSSMVDDRRLALDALSKDMLGAMKLYIAGKQHKFAVGSQKLDALSPLAVMRRGYAIITADGDIVRRAGDVEVGQAVTAELPDGRLDMTVTGRHDMEGNV